MSDAKPAWELIYFSNDGQDYLERLVVPGGWIYRDAFFSTSPIGARERTRVAICFVPAPDGMSLEKPTP